MVLLTKHNDPNYRPRWLEELEERLAEADDDEEREEIEREIEERLLYQDGRR